MDREPAYPDLGRAALGERSGMTLPLAVLSFAVHVLFSPWLLVAIAIVAWIKFRPRPSSPSSAALFYRCRRGGGPELIAGAKVPS